jgi:predicted dehydrogenase
MQVAVIGCGTVAQIMHIPYVVSSQNANLVAVVDPVLDRAECIANMYNVPQYYESVTSLLNDIDVDAVVVCTPSHTHAEVAVESLEAGIHTLIEKPLSVTLEDADQIVSAAEASDAVAMVAYMKRYDPAYERLQEHLRDFSSVDLVTAYDVDPDHNRIINEVYDLVEGSPPSALLSESKAKRRMDLSQAIGTEDEALIGAYDFQLEHVCHDINALRGLFGRVERVCHAALYDSGHYLTAHLEYENKIPCILESGDSNRKWFEQWIRVDSPNGMAHIEFSNPFIRNTPSELRIKQGIEELTETKITPSYDESFRFELEYFFDCIAGEGDIRTTVMEARADLELIIDLFRTVGQGSIDR